MSEREDNYRRRVQEAVNAGMSHVRQKATIGCKECGRLGVIRWRCRPGWGDASGFVAVIVGRCGICRAVWLETWDVKYMGKFRLLCLEDKTPEGMRKDLADDYVRHANDGERILCPACGCHDAISFEVGNVIESEGAYKVWLRCSVCGGSWNELLDDEPVHEGGFHLVKGIQWLGADD